MHNLPAAITKKSYDQDDAKRSTRYLPPQNPGPTRRALKERHPPALPRSAVRRAWSVMCAAQSRVDPGGKMNKDGKPTEGGTRHWAARHPVISLIRQTYGAEVVAFTADIGRARRWRRRVGARHQYHQRPRRRPAQGVRGGVRLPRAACRRHLRGYYLLGTSFARPLIAKMMRRPRQVPTPSPQRHRQG